MNRGLFSLIIPQTQGPGPRVVLGTAMWPHHPNRPRKEWKGMWMHIGGPQGTSPKGLTQDIATTGLNMGHVQMGTAAPTLIHIMRNMGCPPWRILKCSGKQNPQRIRINIGKHISRNIKAGMSYIMSTQKDGKWNKKWTPCPIGGMDLANAILAMTTGCWDQDPEAEGAIEETDASLFTHLHI